MVTVMATCCGLDGAARLGNTQHRTFSNPHTESLVCAVQDQGQEQEASSFARLEQSPASSVEFWGAYSKGTVFAASP